MSGNELLVKVVVPDLLDQLSEDSRRELIDKQYICVSKLYSNSDELKDEIKRLKSDLIFANKCLNTFNKFIKYLNEIRFKFESLLDLKKRLELNSLEIEYNLMIQKIKDRNRLTDGTDCLNYTATVKEEEEDDRMAVDDDISNHSDYDPNVDKSVESSSDEELAEETQKSDTIRVKTNAENYENSINDENLVFKYKCEDCYYQTNYDNLWAEHRNSHLEGVVCKRKVLFCEVCDKKFSNTRAMIVHFSVKHRGYRSGFRQVECLFPGCGVIFVKRNEKFRQHMKRHFIENNSHPFICGPNCQFSSEDYNVLRRHQFKEHSPQEERKQVCEHPGCGQRFYFLECLRKHCKIHLTKSFWCNRCTNMYKDKSHLKEHLIKAHGAHDDVHDMYQYLCNNRKKRYQTQFTDNIVLDRHKKREHRIGHKNPAVVDINRKDFNGTASEDVIFSGEFINEVIDCTVAVNEDQIILSEDMCQQSTDIPVTPIKETGRLVIDESVNEIQEPVIKTEQIDSQFESTSEILDSHPNPTVIVDYYCKDCQFQTFQSLREYDKHNRIIHKRVDRFECQFPGCSTVSNSRYSGLRRHSNRHLSDLNVKHFTCGQNSCDFISKVYNELIRHQIKVHNKSFDTYKCLFTGCGRVFFSIYHFNKHKERHNKNNKSNHEFHCDFNGCKKYFATELELIRHKRIHTNPDPTFKCLYDNCQFESSSVSQIKVPQIKTHLSEHPIRKYDKPFGCPLCHKKYNNRPVVVQHIRLHYDFKDHKCDYKGCNESFHTAVQRDKHVNTVHKMIVERWPCDWPECGFIGKTKSILIHHKYRHTGEMPYACNWPECGKRFRAQATYATHLRLHKNDRCYKCEWPGCEFDTHDRGALRFHKIRHQKQLNGTDGRKERKSKPKRLFKVNFNGKFPKRILIKRVVKKPKKFESYSDFTTSDSD